MFTISPQHNFLQDAFLLQQQISDYFNFFSLK